MYQLHVFNNAYYAPDGVRMNGGEKRIIEILKRWSKMKNFPYKITLYAPKGFIDIIKCENIENIKFKITSTKHSEKHGFVITYLIHTLRALFMLPCGKKNIFFYSPTGFFPNVIPCLIGKAINKNAKYVSLEHHIIENYKTRPGGRLRNFIAYYEQRICLMLRNMFGDKILLVSPLVKEYLLKRKYNPRKLAIVSNGVDARYIQSLNKRRFDLNSYDAVMLARLAPSKGIFELPDIWKRVVEKNPTARLALIGSGDDGIKEELEKKFSEKGISNNVDLLGYVDTDKAYGYLLRAKVFIFTSREEGWGISIAEAMACGLPVVAYELPVYKYIFPKGIVLIKNRNAQEMADKVVKLLQEPQTGRKIGEEGRQYVLSHYDWDWIAEQEKKELDKVCNRILK